MSTIAKQQTSQTVFSILFTIAFTHFINDMCQSVIPSTYPMMKAKYHLTFSQIGLITFSFQLTASLLQPFIGHFTDRTPRPYSLMAGMIFTLLGLVFLSRADSFYTILASASCVGVGSSIFHPESSRVAFLASGGKRGLAQSIFQLGGNGGSAFGPLLVAIIVIPYGQDHIVWFAAAAITGVLILMKVGMWYSEHLQLKAAGKTNRGLEEKHHLPRHKVISALAILLLLIFSKYFYMTSMTSYYTFFLIDKFHLTVQQSQFYLFIFLGAIAAGTLAGGPLGDRFGRKYIIWFSILGAAPFTLLLPYANLFWTGVLAAIIGVIIASAFSAILVYAQELVPGRVGTISGLFFGFAFGIAGIGSALLGKLADSTSISFVFHVCAFLPLLGIITGLLPNLEKK